MALFLPTTLFWATYEQQGNTIVLWADDHTDRTIDLIVWQGEIPVTWFQAFNPFMIFAFTPFIIEFWAWQAKRGTEPSTVTKMALGCFGVALSNLIMAGAAWSAGSGSASWLWLFAYFVVITIGELYLSPIGLSLVSKVAPARMVSMMMGVWLGDQLRRQFRRRLARQLLELYGQDELLHHDRCYCCERRRGDLVLRSPAQRHPPGLSIDHKLFLSGLRLSNGNQDDPLLSITDVRAVRNAAEQALKWVRLPRLWPQVNGTLNMPALAGCHYVLTTVTSSKLFRRSNT